MDLRNKKVTIVGLGESGTSSALLLYRKGAVVSVTDDKDSREIRKNAEILKEKYIDLEIGKHSEGFLEDSELIVVSPGVEQTALPISYARKNDIPVISELELGYQFCKGPIIAVTGTNGKSTVVSLLGEVLRRANVPVKVCGNIGNSLSGEIQKINKNTVAVVEVSSFQLEWIKSFRPKISVILNISEDHLDRHAGLDDYANLKKKILENQEKGDIAVLNYDDTILRKIAESAKINSKIFYFSTKQKVKGVYLDKGSPKVRVKKKEEKLFSLAGAKIEGAHNVENILAVILVAVLLGIKSRHIENAVKGFSPLAHRFEKVGTVKSVEFIDDSKATNIDATRRALASLKVPAILIAGGKDKNLSFKKILPLMRKKVKKLILIGEAKDKMRSIFKDAVSLKEANTLDGAVKEAFKSASPGDVVLLSPMCSSFDMFRDYKERGEAFKRAVEGLKNEEC